MEAYDDLPRKFNLASYFLDRNLDLGRGAATALICQDRAYSYQEVAKRTNEVGHVLRELGVEIEDRVLLALSDGLDFVATWYAVIKVGGVVAEVYTFLQEKDYEYFLNYTRAKVAVVDATTLEMMRAVAPRCQYLRALLVVGAVSDLGEGEYDFDSLVEAAPQDLTAESTTKDDIAIWKFTTGSTGDPKAAVHCHHDPFISFTTYARRVVEIESEDTVIPVPKLFFGYARDLTTLFTFGVGATGVVFPQRTTPELLAELIGRHSPTILVNVPTMMNAMVNHPQAETWDLSSLRLCISSGEALPDDIYHKWMELFGVEILDGIGSSEAYHIYISNRIGNARPGSAGEIVPGYQALIVDEKGNPVPDGETGELWIEGESSALMYWNDHRKSKETFAGDRIRSGDMFTRDEDGYFWYQGRADDLIKVGGIWVSPLEIEECLRHHPAVSECAVIGIEESGLMLPRAYVVVKTGEGTARVGEEGLQEYVKQSLSPHKYPRQVRFVEDLPKTASGKLDRKQLRREAQREAEG